MEEMGKTPSFLVSTLTNGQLVALGTLFDVPKLQKSSFLKEFQKTMERYFSKTPISGSLPSGWTLKDGVASFEDKFFKEPAPAFSIGKDGKFSSPFMMDHVGPILDLVSAIDPQW